MEAGLQYEWLELLLKSELYREFQKFLENFRIAPRIPEMRTAFPGFIKISEMLKEFLKFSKNL